VFDEALQHFADTELLHANRAVLLEEAGRLEDAAASYLRCVEVNGKNDQAALTTLFCWRNWGGLTRL
jgi:predicted RNA polymerase sigma factor